MIIYTLGIVEQNSKILLLLRQNTPFFSGYYGLPGGKVDTNESITYALTREINEELGINTTPDKLQFVHCLSCKNEADKDFLALIFKINHFNGEPRNQEPDKCAEIAWFGPEELPENIIPRHRQIIEMVEKNIMYSENGW